MNSTEYAQEACKPGVKQTDLNWSLQWCLQPFLTKAHIHNTAIIQVNLCQPQPTVNNSMVLLEQRFTARMSLLTATSASALMRRCYCSQQCYLHHLRVILSNQGSLPKSTAVCAIFAKSTQRAEHCTARSICS